MPLRSRRRRRGLHRRSASFRRRSTASPDAAPAQFHLKRKSQLMPADRLTLPHVAPTPRPRPHTNAVTPRTAEYHIAAQIRVPFYRSIVSATSAQVRYCAASFTPRRPPPPLAIFPTPRLPTRRMITSGATYPTRLRSMGMAICCGAIRRVSVSIETPPATSIVATPTAASAPPHSAAEYQQRAADAFRDA